MRKAKIYAGDVAEGRALLARAPAMHLATTTESGRPILRVLHPVLDDDMIAFHAAPVGEKVEGLGRHAVVSVHETVAEIPSWFLDPERACPATTYFVSAQVEGRLEEIADPERKARVLSALMNKFQPEGRHVPITHGDPLYTKAIDGLLVAGVRIDALACKAKLGQNRKPEDRRHVVAQLWKRGDVAAVDLLVRRFPELAPASFVFRGLRLGLGVDEAELDEVMALLADAYWLADVAPEITRRAFRASHVVTARDREGRIVGVARAVSDGRCAWLYDVMVAPSHRGGTGRWLVAQLLDHPAVRDARTVRLATRDAMSLYAGFGFVPVEGSLRPWPSTEMIRRVTPVVAAAP